MSGLELVLALAALLIGLTGAWSPCGFSMVETIGPAGHSGGRRVTAAALATFVPGALLGGVITFGVLAWVGSAIHGAGGRLAYVIAAVVALAAALAEARGTPIVPQIRRQLPEHWRRLMPMPLAAGLYGVLLGLGFTTFVLSYGVWALAPISFAVGDPGTGSLIGFAFGAGRAIPVLLLAPVCRRPSGIRATELMTQRPVLYRGVRRGDAVALGAVAVALMVAPAGAATSFEAGAGHPSGSGTDLVFERLDGTAILRRGNGTQRSLLGTHPALGGPYIALVEGNETVLLDRRSLREAGRLTTPGADALAVSARWLVYRAREDGADAVHVRAIRTGDTIQVSSFGEDDVVARASAPGEIGRPALDDATLVYSRADGDSTSIRERNLDSGRRRTLVATRRWLLSGASVLGDEFSYLRTTNERQEVRVGKLGAGGPGKVAYAIPATSFRDADHAPGHTRLPTRIPEPDRRHTSAAIAGTTLAPYRIYLTLLVQQDGQVSARIERVGR